MQPESMHAHMQSQQAWIVRQQALSPLVQVMHTPSLVLTHSHLHMAMLQQQIMVPFIVQHMLHMPPAIILHKFCNVAAATSSSQTQVTFMPPVHFSTFIVQRGTIIMPGIIAGIPAICPIIGIAPVTAALVLMPRSIITLDIAKLLSSRPLNEDRVGRSRTRPTSNQPMDRWRASGMPSQRRH